MKINLSFENFVNYNYNEDFILKIIQNILNEKNVYENSCLKNLDIKSLEIDFVFCDDKFIHTINKEYRKKDCPTDVISFALFSDSTDAIYSEDINLGEIIISVETAKKQAQEANHSIEKEIYYLISHGILHLLGFDHQTEEEYNFMVDIQNEAIKDYDKI